MIKKTKEKSSSRAGDRKTIAHRTLFYLFMGNDYEIPQIDGSTPIGDFHSSWDWLMPVIRKVYDSDSYYEYKRESSNMLVADGIVLTTNINQAYEETVIFLKWERKRREKRVRTKNKLIADFMKVPSCRMGGATVYTFSDRNNRTEEDLHYHASWNWLIPAVEECFSKPEYPEGNFVYNLNDALLSLNIIELWEAVVSYIEAFNLKMEK